MTTLLLSRDDIKALLGEEEILQIVEAVYRSHGLGEIIMPPKVTIDLSDTESGGSLNAMPAFVIGQNAAGVKFGGGFPLNPVKENLPATIATILLVDPKTGYPLAILEGGYITVVRTGASAAVAAKYLLPSLQRLAVLGVGAVGRAVISAFDRSFPLREIRIYDISETSIQKALSLTGVQASRCICSSPEDCTSKADVIVTATHEDKPLFKQEYVKPGALIISLGSYRELAPLLVMDSVYRIVDNLDQNRHRGEFRTYFEAGKLSGSDIYAEIGDIIAGRMPAPSAGEGWGVASLIGMGSLDIAIAKKAYEEARRDSIGRSFEF